MNIKDYISSGILEAYVLGELSGKEKEEVERNADEYPEVYKEVRQIKEAFYAISVQSQKQAGILPKADLFKNLSQQNNTKEKKIYRIFGNPIKLPIYNFLALIAAILSLITTFTIADFYLKINNIQNYINEVKSTDLNEDVILQSKGPSSSYPEAYNFLYSPEFTRFEIDDFSGQRKLHAWIFWNEKSHKVYLQINSLGSPEKDKKLHLWGIVNNELVSAGVISDVKIGAYYKMERLYNPSHFKITLEQIVENDSLGQSFLNDVKNLL